MLQTLICDMQKSVWDHAEQASISDVDQTGNSQTWEKEIRNHANNVASPRCVAPSDTRCVCFDKLQRNGGVKSRSCQKDCPMQTTQAFIVTFC